MASKYAGNFARWTRERRANMGARYGCHTCRRTDVDLTEYAGRYYCDGHMPDRLPSHVPAPRSAAEVLGG